MALYPAFPVPGRGWPPRSVSRRGLMAGTAALAASQLLVAGCGGGTTKSPAAADEVTYLTGLGSTGREAFAWVADAKGFFADENIKVTIKAGQAGDSNLKLLAAGKAQFAAIDYSGAVVRAGTGKFDGVRVISVVYAKTLIAIMSLASSGIRSPRDLVGRQIAQATGAVPRTLFPAYARLAGLDTAQINSVGWHEAQGTALPQLLKARRVDGIGQFVPGEPAIQAAVKGAEIAVLPYAHYLGDLYGNVIVSPTAISTDLQARFVRAAWRGLRYAVDHPDEAGDILHTAVPIATAAVAAAELRLLTGYVISPVVDRGLVARSIALMQSVGQIPATAIDPTAVANFDIAPVAVSGPSGSPRP